MGKLFKLKKWLTVPETARHLSIVFGEEVADADVLRLALDRHLILSVQLVNGAYARPWVPVQIASVTYREVPALSGDGTVKIPEGGPLWCGERGTLQLNQLVTKLDAAVWDLPMIGGEQLDVERQYQRITSGPAVTLTCLEVSFVESQDGQLFQLQGHLADNPYYRNEALERPWMHPDNFFPARGLPQDSLLVVRTEALRKFEQSINGEPLTPEKQMTTTERNSLLTIIAALCDYSGIKHQGRGAASQIANLTEEIGAAVSDDTVRRTLAKIPDALESRMK